jgi:peptidoglycan/xylan/chitin deacetylase (PgdA/CDA1 family)
MTESRLQQLKKNKIKRRLRFFGAAGILLLVIGAAMLVHLGGPFVVGEGVAVFAQSLFASKDDSQVSIGEQNAGDMTTQAPAAQEPADQADELGTGPKSKAGVDSKAESGAESESESESDAQEVGPDTDTESETGPDFEAEPEVDPVLALLADYDEETILNYKVYKRYLAAPATATAAAADGPKTVYLTIDDGPNPKSTAQILNILAEKNVKATFFVLGSMVQQNPQLLQDIVEAGHGIGNHGFSHVYKNIYKSANNFLWEMNVTKDLIKEVSGVTTNLIRAPGGTSGHFTREFYQTIEKYGYVEQDWNVDTRDSAGKNVTADMILSNAIAQSQGKNEVVVLFHDSGREAVIKALPAMIDYFIKQEYVFKTLPQNRPVAIHRPKSLLDIEKAVLPVLAELQKKSES